MKKDVLIGFLAFIGTCATPATAFQLADGQPFVFADLLFWKLREGSDENWAQEISPSKQEIVILDAPFKWQSGFRLGIGQSNAQNCWDAIFYYTHYQTTATRQAHVNSGAIYSAYLGNFYANNATGGLNFGPNYYDASINWRVNFNTFDLEFGHTIALDCVLRLRPYFGIKGAIINNHIATLWHNPANFNSFTTANENLKNDFWGIGPVLGLQTTWPINIAPQCHLSLFGNLSGSLMWGHWKFEDNYQNDSPTHIAINTTNTTGAGTMARGLLGIAWSGCFANTKVNIHLAYEAQVWFNQLQYYNYNMGKLNNLLSLQGGVLGLNINF